MIPPNRDDLAARVAFDVEDITARRLRALVGLALGVVLMPAGAVMDWFAYPQSFSLLLTLRLLVAGILAAGWGVIWRVPLGRKIYLATLVLVLLPTLTLAGFIYLTDGAQSSYYYGLILLMIIVQLLGLSAAESAIYCGLTTLAYGVSVAAHSTFSADDRSRVVLTTLILCMAGTVCVAACHLNQRYRLNDFLLRRKLDESNRQLRELDRMRMTFLAEISHELRTPLSTILVPLQELLTTPGLPQHAGETLAIASRSGDRLRVLVNDLLDIVRLEQATFRLDLQVVDAREFVQTVLASIRSLVESRGVQLRSQITTTPIELSIDVIRFERVLHNLISNAVKFSPEGSAVTVSLEKTDGHALIAVRDEGPGVPADEREAIFERFFQSERTQQRAAQGLGLGLAIARDIVRWHQGDIWVTDAPQQGSVFTVRIPSVATKQAIATGAMPTKAMIAPAEANREAANNATGEGAPRSENILDIGKPVPARENRWSDEAPPEVLVVDDEPDLRLTLLRSLSSDFRVGEAKSAAEALELAKRWRPRCVVLDFMLPDDDGLEVIRKLRREPSLQDTRIIMLTAHFDENVKLEALNRGADDFLVKPFGMTEVRARVAGLVRRSRLETDLRREQEELRISLEKLHAAEVQLVQSEKMRAVGSLAAGLLHEINNPVNFTLMAARLLKQRLENSPAESEMVKDIHDGIQRVGDIITDLRTFAHPEQQVGTLDFPLSAAVTSAIRFTAHACQNLRLDCQSASIDGIMAHGAKSQVIQVLVNLLTNAANALKENPTPKNPPVIQIHATIVNGRVRVCVSDNGSGMSPEVLARVREPFFTTAEPGQGMGLGLSICDTIVKSHGGELEIESIAGRGTTVSFDLPLASTT